jgi:fructokinase
MDETSRILSFGEILWDVLPEKKMPGGAPMNVALHLHKLGLNVSFLSRIGKDIYGKELREFIESARLGDYILQEDDQHETGQVKVDLTDSNDPQYDIVFPSAWDYIEYTEQLDQRVKNSDMIIYGSLASRGERSRETLLQILDQHVAYHVFDVNLRTPYYSKERVHLLMDRADLVKMNEVELEILSEWFVEDTGEKQEKTRLEILRSLFDLSVICVTRGAKGASMLFHGEYFQHPGFVVSVKDTIGSGDAFLGGLVYGLLHQNDPSYILKYASATGAVVASKAGANPLFDKGEIHQLINHSD